MRTLLLVTAVVVLVTASAANVRVHAEALPAYLPGSWSEAFSRADKLTRDSKDSACDDADRICALGRSGLSESALSVPRKLHQYCATFSVDTPVSCREPAFVADRLDRLKATTEKMKGRVAWAGSGAWTAAQRNGGTLKVSDVAAFLELTKTALRESACPRQRRVCMAGRIEAVMEADQLLRTTDLCGNVPASEKAICGHKVWRLSSEIGRLGRDQLSPLLASTDWIDAVAWGPFMETDAFVLVQHLDDDPQYQAWALKRLETSMLRGKTDPSRYAYLSDRIEVAAGREQSFGTQGECALEGGKSVWRAMPMRDPDKVEERRAAFHMTRFSSYRSEMDRLCS